MDFKYIESLNCRYRRQIGADKIKIFSDIKKKHSAHAVTADVNIAETAKAADFFRADGVIITGSSTGDPASPDELIQVAAAVSPLDIFIGSGITAENLGEFRTATGLIIGTYFKQGGDWRNALDRQKIFDIVSLSKELI